MKTLKNLLYLLFCFIAVFNIDSVKAKTDGPQIESLKKFQERCYDLALFVDDAYSLVAFCHVANYGGDGKSKIFFFSQRGDSWCEEEKNCAGNTPKIISDGKFRLVTYDNYSRETQNLFQVYDVTEDLKIPDNPKLSLNLYSTQKFKKEGIRNFISVVPTDKPDSFLVLGEYFASNLNLFTLWPRIASAGHAGIVDIPFAAQITDGKVTGFYNLQTKFQDRETVSRIQGVAEGQKVHVTWIKGRDYGPDTPKVMYAQFDLKTHNWSDVTELFKGTKSGSKKLRYFEEPSVLLLGQNLYCAWSNANMKDDRGQPLDKPLDSSGVFLRVKDKDGWSSIYKASNCEANRCKLAAGRDGKVHLFWIDYQKKVYHASRDETGWQEPVVIHEDSTMDWTLPFDVKIDGTGNFHMLYIRRTSYTSPNELVYVKLEKQPGRMGM
jgi:hypothetical protein